MDERAVGLRTVDHGEVVLVAVQPGEEDDPGSVVGGGRLEEVAAEDDGRFHQGPVGVHVALVQRLEAWEAAGAMAAKTQSRASL
jgi:hypothetical protein